MRGCLLSFFVVGIADGLMGSCGLKAKILQGSHYYSVSPATGYMQKTGYGTLKCEKCTLLLRKKG